ncbi:MAG: hypothetical protein ACKO2P_03625 [Planctomycetota bacterium]
MTVHEIRTLLRSIESVLLRPTAASEAELMGLAEQHEAIVSDVSARLEQVEQLLQKGLRTEAIELAERDPNLNDLLTLLDFPELIAWNELLQQKGIQPVQGISVEAAAELNDAYHAAGSIERLLQHYRTVSLLRAPLNRRIAVLRQLAAKDPANAIWQVDLKLFEQHRLRELRQEIDKAASAGDLQALAACDAEVAGGSWTTEVPATLREHARTTHESLRRRQAREELTTISHQLSDAYSAFDRGQAERLEKRLLALQAILSIAPGHALLEIAAPALIWLSDERRKEQAEQTHFAAVRELESQLDGRTTLQNLERLYHQATCAGYLLPPALQSRLVERRDQLTRDLHWKRSLAATAVIITLLLLAGGIGWMIQISNTNRTIARHAEQLGQLLATAATSGELAPTEAYLQDLRSSSPEILLAPQLRARVSEFESLLSSERGRQQRLQQLGQSITDVVNGQPDLQQLTAAESTADELRRLTRSESERAEHTRLLRLISTRRTAIQTTLDDAFSSDLKRLSDQVAQISADNLAEFDSTISALTALNSRPDISQNLKALSNTLLQKVQGDRRLAADALKTAADLQRITDAVGRVQTYEQALEQFIRNDPGRARSAAFRKLLQDELSVWQAAELWKPLRQSLLQADLRRLAGVEAGQLLQRCQDYQKQFGPQGDDLLQSQLLRAVKKIAARDAVAGRSFRDRVLAIFSSPLIGRTWLVETQGRGNYFCSRPPQVNGTSTVTVEYYISTSGTQTKTTSLRYTDVPAAAIKTTADEWLSPQSRLLTTVEQKLPAWQQLSFEAGAAACIREILAAETVDPILRFFLLEDALRMATDGSEFFQQRCKAVQDQLAAAQVSRLVNYAAPDDTRAETVRFTAKRELERSSDALAAAVESAEADVALPATAGLPPELYWVGWLHRNPSGEWVVSLRASQNPAAQRGGRLLIFPRAAAQQPRTVVLGQLEPKTSVAKTVEVPPELVQEGRPVFLELSAESADE